MIVDFRFAETRWLWTLRDHSKMNEWNSFTQTGCGLKHFFQLLSFLAGGGDVDAIEFVILLKTVNHASLKMCCLHFILFRISKFFKVKVKQFSIPTFVDYSK